MTPDIEYRAPCGCIVRFFGDCQWRSDTSEFSRASDCSIHANADDLQEAADGWRDRTLQCARVSGVFA